MTRPTPPPLLQCWCPCQLPCFQAECTLYDQPWNSRTISVSGAPLSGRFSGSCNTPISLELREDLPSLIGLHRVLYSGLSLEPKSGFVTVTTPEPLLTLLPLLHLSSSGAREAVMCHPPERRLVPQLPEALLVEDSQLSCSLRMALGKKKMSHPKFYLASKGSLHPWCGYKSPAPSLIFYTTLNSPPSSRVWSD